ncbi:MAG TPA: cardiolipin synthase [Polyangiaceae bacterium]|nr:cardiolipin synthase [Polyangiaceae bacterium]
MPEYFVDVVFRGHASVFATVMALSEVLALGTIPSVLLQRQGQPRAALAWLLALFAIPAGGVFWWWAFGRSSMARKQRRRAESTREFMGRHGLPHTETVEGFARLVPPAALGDSIFTSDGNRVELLFDGRQAYPAMEAALREAKQTIHVLFYIFRDDDTGRRFRDLLVERAKAGVTVRVLVDAWGTPRFTGAFSRPLRAAGARVAAFRPSRFAPPFAPRFAFVNHRKLVVVDDAIAFTGGMNVGDEYASEWHDLMAKIEGPAVHALDHVFLDDWYFASDEEVREVDRDEFERPGNVACAVVASGPDREAFIHDTYFLAFTRAEARIWIATPYFIPSAALSTALRTAAGRGVDVRIVLPTASDVWIAKHAARSFYPNLLRAGVKIHEYEGPMVHAKAFVVDDGIASVGSANVDSRSFLLSFELSCFLRSPALNAELARWFEGLVASSHAVTLAECRSRNTGELLLESAAHLFSPLL